MPINISSDRSFQLGKASQLTPKKEQYDAAIIANGETVYPAFLASQILAERQITSCVLSMHTIRPFDEEAVRNAALQSKVLLTVEEHSVNGGLGSRVSSLLMQAGIYVPLKIVGIPDEHTVAGSQTEIFTHYGITANDLAKDVIKLLEASH